MQIYINPKYRRTISEWASINRTFKQAAQARDNKEILEIVGAIDHLHQRIRNEIWKGDENPIEVELSENYIKILNSYETLEPLFNTLMNDCLIKITTEKDEDQREKFTYCLIELDSICPAIIDLFLEYRKAQL